jgi:hypothetical protein
VLDSSGKHDTSAPAAGWFKRLRLRPMRDGGDMLIGDCELTELGAQQLNDGLYKYDSVEIDSVVLNDTGDKVPNVFKSATLTNTPVLRMLPPVLDVAEHVVLAEPVEVALSEIVLADAPDPVAALCDKIDALLSELSDTLKGKAGIPTIRTMMREVRAKAGVHVAAAEDEDDGNPVEPAEAVSHDRSQDAKDGEGQTVTLAEGDAAEKGSDTVDPKIIEVLKLSEDADEAAVEAAIVTLSEERDSATARAEEAEGKLAEAEKVRRATEVEAKLSELVEGGHLAPGKRDELLAMAEESPSAFDTACELLKTAKVIDLTEHGTHEGADTDADPAADVEKRALALAEQRGIEYSEAYAQAMASTPGLADRRFAELTERIANT